MLEKRCKKCNRLLYIELWNGVKQVKSNGLTYNTRGQITTICKCGYIND